MQNYFSQKMHRFSLKTNIMHYELCIQHYFNLSSQRLDKLKFEEGGLTFWREGSKMCGE